MILVVRHAPILVLYDIVRPTRTSKWGPSGFFFHRPSGTLQDLRYRYYRRSDYDILIDRYLHGQPTISQVTKNLRYCITILTIDIVVLTFNIVVPDIAKTTISQIKNFDIGCVLYRRIYDIVGQNYDIHISRYKFLRYRHQYRHQIWTARHPALQAIRSCTGHELQCT